MGRYRMWVEDMIVRFAEGTFARIDRVRTKGETRTDYMRAAAELLYEKRTKSRVNARKKPKKKVKKMVKKKVRK
jgi:hypothetical protein